VNKQKRFTAAGIALSFAIAIGGWAVTSALIDIKSDTLLSASGVTWTNTSDAGPSTQPNQDAAADDPDPSGDLPTLTEYDLISVLKNWETPGRETPHEPTAEQIGMEEAMIIGEAALSSFDKQGILFTELLTFDKSKTTACLFQNIPLNQAEQFLPPIYSYWVVVFRGEGRITAAVIVNAVTGQVGKIDILLFPYVAVALGVEDIQNTLTAFMEESGMRGGEKVDSMSDDFSIISFTKSTAGGVYAVINIRCRPLPIGEGETELMQVKIYLSTQVP
jgi:hypothetical protein